MTTHKSKYFHFPFTPEEKAAYQFYRWKKKLTNWLAENIEGKYHITDSCISFVQEKDAAWYKIGYKR